MAIPYRNRDRSIYERSTPASGDADSIEVDVYSVLTAYNVTCPAISHAVKKLLLPGERGKGDVLSDLEGALEAIQRAIELRKQVGE